MPELPYLDSIQATPKLGVLPTGSSSSLLFELQQEVYEEWSRQLVKLDEKGRLEEITNKTWIKKSLSLPSTVTLERLHAINTRVKNYQKQNKIGTRLDDEVFFYQYIYPKLSKAEKRIYSTFVLNDEATVAETSNFYDQLKGMEQKGDLVYVQQDMLYTLYSLPNDPMASQQWGLINAKCVDAWSIAQGKGINVAVVDTGIDYQHPDIKLNLWQDVAGNYGINVISASSQDNQTMELLWHGTHVAGIIAAQGDNKEGICGIAPQAKVMTVKVFQSGVITSSKRIAVGIRYAVDNGAHIVNLSLGPNFSNKADPLIINEINAAVEAVGSTNTGSAKRPQGVVVVCAAGNDGKDVEKFSPANHPKVITVAATEQANKLMTGSRYGKLVDIAAPGYAMLSLLSNMADSDPSDLDFGYASKSGTSMATAVISGVVALMLSKNGSLTPDQVKTILQKTVQLPPSDLTTMPLGGGLVDIYQAVNAA